MGGEDKTYMKPPPTKYRFALVSNNLFMVLDDPPIMELGSSEQRSPGPPLEFEGSPGIRRGRGLRDSTWSIIDLFFSNKKNWGILNPNSILIRNDNC